MPGMDHGTAAGQFLTEVMAALLPVCALASLAIRSRRGGAGVVSFGLLLSAALLVAIGGGLTDLHFAYFLVVGLISLYQDWLWLVLAVVLVSGQHLVMGLVAPAMIYSAPGAGHNLVGFALLHAGFVLGICAVQVAYWRFIYSAQQEMDRVRADAERSARRSAERFEAVVQEASDVLTVVGRDGRVVSASRSAERVMGYRPAGLAGVRYHSLIHPGDAAQVDLGVGDGRLERRFELRIRHADGSWQWHEVIMRDMFDNPAVAGWVINHRDVTERRRLQQRLEHEATHDALTGLPNRGRLLGELRHRLAAGAPGAGLAVLYLDLDGFKQVNDKYGHETGDALLIAVARSLQKCVLGADMVGRLGGDEFAAVLNHITAPEDAVAVAARIVAGVAKSVTINGTVISARISIGIALAEPGSVGTDELLHRADTAMYHAKRDARTSWRLYTASMADPRAAAVTPEAAGSRR
jgi:diguanylate cyclase (GGDEF)-like protein/PAS domain S-box-containing protein